MKEKTIMATVAQTCRDVETIIETQKVSGAESIINALVYASLKNPYLKDKEYLHRLIDMSYESEIEWQKREGGRTA